MGSDFWWVRDDCCGVFCGMMTNILLMFALFVQMTFVVGPRFGYLHPLSLMYISLTMMACVSHCRTQFTNPGAVPLDNENLIDLENQNMIHKGRYCNRCKQSKPADAHHCSSCRRCIIRMDHHCPWVNNCVAMFNQKYFVLFLFYTALCCAFCLVSLVSRFIACNGHSTAPRIGRMGHHGRLGDLSEEGMNNNNNVLIEQNSDITSIVNKADVAQTGDMIEFDWCYAGSMDIMFCIVNVFEGVLFGLFTCIMTCDQISSIISNVTYIDSITMSRSTIKQRKKDHSGMDNLSFVFGEPLSINWFLPTRLTPKIRENFSNLCQK